MWLAVYTVINWGWVQQDAKGSIISIVMTNVSCQIEKQLSDTPSTYPPALIECRHCFSCIWEDCVRLPYATAAVYRWRISGQRLQQSRKPTGVQYSSTLML